jgi:hypothetical protein
MENQTRDLHPTNSLFSLLNVLVLCLLVLIALLFLTSNLFIQINKMVPRTALKAPLFAVMLAPVFMQVCNFLQVWVSPEWLPAIGLASKTYLGVTFYCFYLLLREVIFFE